MLCGLFWRFDDENHWEKPVLACPIDGYRSKCLPDGGIQWLLVSPGPPPLGDARGIVPPHCNGHRNVPQSRCIYSSLCVWLSSWHPREQYGASKRPMVAFSGFRYGPGHPPSGNATWIASLPPHGHWNGLQWGCIRSLPLPFLLSIIVAKDHVMVH